MKRKGLALILILALLLSLSACKKEPTGSEAETTNLSLEPARSGEAEFKKKITIGYYSKASLNPFETESRTNLALCSLLYDPLFKLDSNYEPIPYLAQDFTKSGKSLTVVLKPEISFSDGSLISSSDVVYSFTKAKSSPLFAKRLSNFSSCFENGDSVVFKLFTDDVFAAACLDFPIVKRGSADRKSLIGSGRYILKKNSDGYYLKANELPACEEEMEQQKIFLFDLNSPQEEMYLIQIGELSCYFDETNENRSSKIGANKAQISLNNLVFLGINSGNELLQNDSLRKALSLCVNKDELVGTGFDSLGRKTDLPFNPDWSQCLPFKEDEKSYDMSKSIDILGKGGLIQTDTLERQSAYLNLSLLYCNENEEKQRLAENLKAQLEKVRIHLDIEGVSYEQYFSRLESGDFQLYLGEIKLTPNMSLFPFFSTAGEARFGIDMKSPVRDAYYDFTSGKIDVATFASVFKESIPFVPLCFCDATVYYSRSMKYQGTVNENDIYSNIFSWGA